MVFNRPNNSGQGRPKPPVKRPEKPKTKPVQKKQDGNGRGNGKRRGGGRSDDPNNPPSPWLIKDIIAPDKTASFVEYLRWMREYDNNDKHKDPRKVELLQLAEDNANYRTRLTQLTQRTQLIAKDQKGEAFEARCLWRIRVGGHRGPESILLPAFDALGMPYIPASSLRGAARTQAIREKIKENPTISWKKAEEIVSRQYFGFLDSTEPVERSGKVTFLDAYPLPQKSGNDGGLTVDMANSIWSWDAAGKDMLYSPNPNSFFSLLEATFLIGICPTQDCDQETLNTVKRWLKEALQTGIGSQVNTGYGSLVTADSTPSKQQFFDVEFALEGQLIHGRQLFTQWNWNDRRNEWQMRGKADAEVRPVAFKSMLRYWFRTFALGVIPSQAVQGLEAKVFGAITPKQTQGWLRVQIADGRVVQREARPYRDGKNDPCGEQSGRLILAYSAECPIDYQDAVKELTQTLTWMMFHLGGIGQGARRPRYSRSTRERAPWWRGSTLFPESQDEFWKLPSDVKGFQQRFQQRQQRFYRALQRLSTTLETPPTIDPQNPSSVGDVNRTQWTEAIDRDCSIIVCTGNEDFEKPYALAQLHHRELKVRDQRGQYDYDGNLCGQVRGGVKPSPVWIADLEEYQVVTVFGATQDPRKQFIRNLKQRTNNNNFAPIWPMEGA